MRRPTPRSGRPGRDRLERRRPREAGVPARQQHVVRPANPPEAKKLIDAASDSTPAHARGCIDAFLTVYWFVLEEPEASTAASARTSRLTAFPPSQARPPRGPWLPWAAEAGRTSAALTATDAGYAAAAQAFDTPHSRFNIADACVTALLLSGDVAQAAEVAADPRKQSADLPGMAQALATGVAGRAALAAGELDTACATAGRGRRDIGRRGPWPRLGIPIFASPCHRAGYARITPQAASALAAGCQWRNRCGQKRAVKLGTTIGISPWRGLRPPEGP